MNPLNPVTTATIYDAAGRVTMSIDPLGNTNRTVYNAMGKPDFTMDRFGNTNSFLYDARGNLVQSSYPNGTFTRTVFDANARPVYSSDRNGVTGARTDYDALGRATNTVRLSGMTISVSGSGGIYSSTLGTQHAVVHELDGVSAQRVGGEPDGGGSEDDVLWLLPGRAVDVGDECAESGDDLRV